MNSGILNPEMKVWMIALKNRAATQKGMGQDGIQILWKGRRPPGFPKGEFVSQEENGTAYAVNCDKVIAWVDSILNGVGDENCGNREINGCPDPKPDPTKLQEVLIND